MEPEVWRKVSDIFSDCLALPVAERTTFLANLENADPGITAEIRKLLATYEGDEEFLEKPAIQEEAQLLRHGGTGTDSAGQAQFAPEVRAPLHRGKHPSFWWFMGGNLVVFCCFIFALSVIGRYKNKSVEVGWWARPDGNGWSVTFVDNPGPAAGALRVGDSIRSINQNLLWRSEIRTVTPGAEYSMQIAREGQVRDLTLRKAILRNDMWPGGILAILLVSLTYFLTAVTVSVMRPGPGIITLAWAALAGEAITLLALLLHPYTEFLTPGAFTLFAWMQLADGPHLAFSFHFYSRVFRSERSGRVARVFVWVLYTWGIGCALYWALVLNFRWAPAVAYFWNHPLFWRAAMQLEDYFYLAAPFFVCVAVVHSYVRAQGIEERRRARWIAVGSLAGIVPYLLIRIAGALGLPDTDYFVPLGILPAALIPIATGYAILKHRLFDIHVVLRRGLQYLVARNALRLILALPAMVLLYALATNANRTVGELVLHNWIFVALVVLIAVVLRFRQRFSTWLDRRFFREGYQQERILLALIDDLRNLDSVPEMGQRVVTELAAALHPESIYFFYHSPQDRAFLRGFGTDARADGLQIPEGSALPHLLSRSDHALSVESFPSEGVPLMSWSWLYTLRIDLTVPMNRTDGSPVGFLLLGRKKSEEPYSPVDRKLLLGLGRAMAVGCENLLLHERVQRQQRTNEEMRSRVEGMGTAWLQECPKCGRCFDCSLRACAEDGSELSLSLPVHHLLEDRYRLDRILGRGGMGTVFEAMDLRLQRQVAVKLVQAGRTAHPGWLRRFNREARALARLNHQNVVSTYDFGVVEDEVAYLVMEFVPGTTLRKQLEMGPVPPARAASWFDQVLEGVSAAHAAGIVHRDLKPENLLLAHLPDGQERIKIADFGVAKWQAAETESVSLTLPGTIVGSLRYMSPEQLAGQPVDARSDIFSVGVVIFEALTGKLPFSGASYAERVASAEREIEHLDGALAGEPEIQAILRKCLARNPEDRYRSATELQNDLIPRLARCRSTLPVSQGEPA